MWENSQTDDPRPRLCQFLLVSVIALTASAGVATADESQSDAQRTAARELGTVGMQAYFDKDYARAAENLDRAYRLFPTPTLGLWSGRALVQNGKWLQAVERLREAQQASAAVGDSVAQRQAQADAATELASLEPRVPRLTITLDRSPPTDVAVTVDQVPFDRSQIGVAHPIDPGPHTVVGSFQGKRVEVELELLPGENRSAHLTFEGVDAVEPVAEPTKAAAPAEPPIVRAVPAPTPAPALASAPASEPAGLRTAAIVSLSVGGAGLLTSLMAMLLARGELDACTERNGEYFCPDRVADTYETYRGVAAATFYGGAALAGAGVALWFLQPNSERRRVAVTVTRLGADVSIKF